MHQEQKIAEFLHHVLDSGLDLCTASGSMIKTLLVWPHYHLQDLISRISPDYLSEMAVVSDADARKFMEIMDTFGLLQHITTPMHVSRHLLALIISRLSNDINIFSPKSTHYISNHCFAECHLALPCHNIICHILFHKRYKKLVPRALLSYISTQEFLRTLEKCKKHLPSARASPHFSCVLKNCRVLI